jgi:hypothetical protein
MGATCTGEIFPHSADLTIACAAIGECSGIGEAAAMDPCSNNFAGNSTRASQYGNYSFSTSDRILNIKCRQDEHAGEFGTLRERKPLYVYSGVPWMTSVFASRTKLQPASTSEIQRRNPDECCYCRILYPNPNHAQEIGAMMSDRHCRRV